MRFGGADARLKNGLAAAAPPAASGFEEAAATPFAADPSVRPPDPPPPPKPVRRFGMPSSVTVATIVTGCPTLALSVLLLPSTFTVGGLFARISGLLEPAPSAPVSDARTTSSTR